MAEYEIEIVRRQRYKTWVKVEAGSEEEAIAKAKSGKWLRYEVGNYYDHDFEEVSVIGKKTEEKQATIGGEQDAEEK